MTDGPLFFTLSTLARRAIISASSFDLDLFAQAVRIAQLPYKRQEAVPSPDYCLVLSPPLMGSAKFNAQKGPRAAPSAYYDYTQEPRRDTDPFDARICKLEYRFGGEC